MLTWKQETLLVTASFGVACIQALEGEAADLLHAADQAMYAAKASGRNCVCSAAGAPMSFGLAANA